uniref:Uncharacterized protein n=1 Tax=Cacopsylla melanoneura TaxID=428564 RepID=A0A8D8M001_9HEMI
MPPQRLDHGRRLPRSRVRGQHHIRHGGRHNHSQRAHHCHYYQHERSWGDDQLLHPLPRHCGSPVWTSSSPSQRVSCLSSGLGVWLCHLSRCRLHRGHTVGHL